MLTEVNGVAFESTGTTDSPDCSGCVARGVAPLCQALCSGCAEYPLVWKFADPEHERNLFEEACVVQFAKWRLAGNSNNDNGSPSIREALCWRKPDGTYGVTAINAAWWGWQEHKKVLG